MFIPIMNNPSCAIFFRIGNIQRHIAFAETTSYPRDIEVISRQNLIFQRKELGYHNLEYFQFCSNALKTDMKADLITHIHLVPKKIVSGVKVCILLYEKDLWEIF